jgi:transposase-like protein
MESPRSRRREITPAQRGQIIQRIIVDGLESADVAAAFGVPKRLVDIWVADFRKNGMSSLRRDCGPTIGAELAQLAISRPTRWVRRIIAIGLRLLPATDPQTRPIPLWRSNKDGSV